MHEANHRMGYIGHSGQISDYIGHCGQILDYIGHIGQILDYIGHCGQILDYIRHSGQISDSCGISTVTEAGLGLDLVVLLMLLSSNLKVICKEKYLSHFSCVTIRSTKTIVTTFFVGGIMKYVYTIQAEYL